MFLQFHADTSKNEYRSECIKIDLPKTEMNVESESIVVSKELLMIKRMISDIKLDRCYDDETSLMLQSNDIIPSVYEGGFKTWECSLDLTRYLIGESLQGKRVLELGCGSGLPGIYTLIHGAHVTFQDYNTQVLRYSTIPNVLLNMDEKVKTELNNGIFEHSLSYINDLNSEFWAGDWDTICKNWTNQYQFDLILSSETIYDSSAYSSFTSLIDTCLKPGGKVLIAAKYQYFGCSGSLSSFMHYLHLNYPSWTVSTVADLADGVRRSIVQIVKE